MKYVTKFVLTAAAVLPVLAACGQSEVDQAVQAAQQCPLVVSFEPAHVGGCTDNDRKLDALLTALQDEGMTIDQASFNGIQQLRDMVCTDPTVTPANMSALDAQLATLVKASC